MKQSGPFPILKHVSRFLTGILIVLGLILAAGTAYGLLVLKPKTVTGTVSDAVSAEIFTGIGRIRTALTGSEPATVILSITFPYDSGDRPFSEELASKVKDFRSIAIACLQSYSAGELQSKEESSLKAEILRRYNEILRLGRIQILYFNDFMIIN
jgi:flagellar basal body-associated protein FliL